MRHVLAEGCETRATSSTNVCHGLLSTFLLCIVDKLFAFAFDESQMGADRADKIYNPLEQQTKSQQSAQFLFVGVEPLACIWHPNCRA
jgi:hypothetical protein